MCLSVSSGCVCLFTCTLIDEFNNILINLYDWLDNTELAKRLPQHTQYIKYILEQGVAPATYLSYKSAFKQYVNWCISYDIQIWPVTDIKWLYYSVERGIKLK